MQVVVGIIFVVVMTYPGKRSILSLYATCTKIRSVSCISIGDKAMIMKFAFHRHMILKNWWGFFSLFIIFHYSSKNWHFFSKRKNPFFSNIFFEGGLTPLYPWWLSFLVGKMLQKKFKNPNFVFFKNAFFSKNNKKK